MKNKKINSNTLLLLITIALFVVMYVVGCIIYSSKGFTHLQTFLNILINNAGLLCVACGMTCVMLTGGIDISVGSLIAMDCMLLAVGMEQWGMNAVVLCMIVLLIGVVFGLVQGFCVGYLEIQPFIVTMAGMFFARGMTTIVNTDPFNVANESFVALKGTRIVVPGMGSVNKLGNYVDAYIEIGVIVALVVVAILFVMLKWTKLGRQFYAVGGNAQSAMMLGINVKRTKFLAHLFCGLLAANP